jgi:hypothetical protein
MLEYPITEENWPVILNGFRSVTGRVGATNMIGKSFEWTSASPTLFHVAVSPQGEYSRVRVTSNVGEWGGLCHMFAGILAFLTSLILVASHRHWPLLMDLLVIAGTFILAFIVARTIYQAIGKAHYRETNALLSVLQNQSEPESAATTEAAPYRYQMNSELKPAQQVLGRTDRG